MQADTILGKHGYVPPAEAALFAAVIFQAKTDMMEGNDKEFLDALRWAYIRRTDEVCSFLYYCEALHWDPSRIRLLIRQDLPPERAAEVRRILRKLN